MLQQTTFVLRPIYGVSTLSETENDFCSETDEMTKSIQSHWLLLTILSVSLQKSFSVSLNVITPLHPVTATRLRLRCRSQTGCKAIWEWRRSDVTSARCTSTDQNAWNWFRIGVAVAGWKWALTSTLHNDCENNKYPFQRSPSITNVNATEEGKYTRKGAFIQERKTFNRTITKLGMDT